MFNPLKRLTKKSITPSWKRFKKSSLNSTIKGSAAGTTSLTPTLLNTRRFFLPNPITRAS